MKDSTKLKILEAGAIIIRHKGFNHTGIQEILKAAGVPKGSFYFHFKNKEDFGLQVIDFFNDFFKNRAYETFNNSSIPPLERLEMFLRGFIEFFESLDYMMGCPIGNLSQEMGDLSLEFRKKLKESVAGMVDIYSEILTEAKNRGDLSDGVDIKSTSDFIVSSWHGALVRMKIEKTAEPLENHIYFVMNKLL